MDELVASAVCIWCFLGSFAICDPSDIQHKSAQTVKQRSNAWIAFLTVSQFTLAMIAVIILVCVILGPYLPDTTLNFGP